MIERTVFTSSGFEHIGIFESVEKSMKSNSVSRDEENLLRGRRFKRAEISPNVLATWEERFHQFSPPRMEEIRNDYTRDSERGDIPLDLAI